MDLSFICIMKCMYVYQCANRVHYQTAVSGTCTVLLNQERIFFKRTDFSDISSYCIETCFYF